MDERLTVIKNVLIKRIFFILLIGAICSGLLVFEKEKYTVFHIKTGAFQLYQMIQIDDSKDRSSPYYEFDYRGFLTSNHNFDSMITSLEKTDKQVFISFVRGWPGWSRNQQITWLRNKIKIVPYRDNTFEVSFNLTANEVTDVAVIKKNADRLLDGFLLQSSDNIKMIKPNTRISRLARNTLIPKNVPLNKRDILKKYAVIGFVFGVVIAAMAFSIKALRDYK